jgi:hypothetical protein
MVWCGNYHHGVNVMRIAPFTQRWAFILCALNITWDSGRRFHPQIYQFTKRLFSSVFIADTPPFEFVFDGVIGRGRKNGNLIGHSAMEKIGSLERACTTGTHGNDDHVGTLYRLIRNEQPPAFAQNGSSTYGYRKANNNCKHR